MFLFLLIVFLGLSFDRLNVFRYCIASCIIHERGHIIAYRLYTSKWPEISVSIFGFKMKNNVLFNKNRNKIIFSGPAANLICAIIALIFTNFIFTLKLYIFACINFFIFFFNILPVYYLDGGQILYNKYQFYQNNFKYISAFSLLLFCVMLYTFTDNQLLLTLPFIYYIINILNDI